MTMPRNMFAPAAVLALVVTLAAGTAAQGATDYSVSLARRDFVPPEEVVTRDADSHLVVQFYDVPTAAERDDLALRGIVLLDYLPNLAWTASVRAGATEGLDRGLVRAVFALAPEDKIAPRAVGRRTVRAFVYRDVEDAEGVVGVYGEILGRDRNVFTLRLHTDARALAVEDIVEYIDGELPEKELNNDVLRDAVNADEVQVAPYGLTGAGLMLGMWDGGAAATNHADYSSRLTIGDGSSTHYHATMVAGTMAGDGTRSAHFGGDPYQWRGVAIEADVLSYSWPDDVADMDDEHDDAISNHEIVLSQNSWGWGLCDSYCEYYGDYDDWSQNYDKIVRGSQGKKLPVIFSAGNDGDCYGCESDLPDFPYGTVPGPGSTAKNTIVVGSTDGDNDQLSDYSSRGPTGDGRLKPDITAPGCKSYGGVTSTYLNNNYNSSYCGTSFSAPIVSGCVALLQEDFIPLFGHEPWPSTVKALLIQGAEDLGNTGPDYSFGFGRIDIQRTVDIVRDDAGAGDLIKEASISPGGVYEHEVVVVSESELRVTLAWDDYHGSYSGGGRKLVNDLDLELESAGGTVYYPWLLDPDNPTAGATHGVDALNNVEQIIIAAPAPGTWTIRVRGTLVPEPDQDFSLVLNVAGDPDLPPAAPTGLGAVPGPGEGEISVSWDANGEPDLDHYRLEHDTNPGFGSPASFTTTETSFVDSGLAPGATYYYRVFAVDAGSNESDPSDTASADALDLAPAAPTWLLVAPGPSEGEIGLMWNPNPETDLDHYRLERDADPGFPAPVPATTTGTELVDSGLVPGATYYYRLFAVDAGGNESAPSIVESAEALDLPPAAPAGLVAVPGPGEGEISVSWDASGEPDLDHYRLERDTDPGFPGPVSFTTSDTGYLDLGLLPGETYHYRVIAIDAGGNESDPSDTASAEALDLPPAAPTGLVAVPGPGEGEITLSWNANGEPDLDHYRLERSTSPEFEPGSEPFEMPATSYQDSGLVPGATYYYRLFAVDAGGNESAPSIVESAEALDLPPAAPAGLVAVPGPGEGEISVSWDANGEPDLDHYRLERSTSPEFEPGSEPFDLPATSYQDSGLVPGETYYYRVIAVDANSNESDPSDTASAEALDLPPAAPTGLVAVPGPGEGEISLSWNANPELDLDHYRLERSTSPEFEPGSEPFEMPATSYQDSGLVPGETYYYRVIAVDSGSNESDPSSTTSADALDLAPAAPTGLVAVSGPGEGEISVSWNANPELDLDHYRVERDTTELFGPGTASFTVGGTVYNDTGLELGQAYYYRLFAVDAGGNEGGPSATASSLPQNLAPAAPTGLEAEPGAGDGEVLLSWDANVEPDLDHYRGERDTTDLFGVGTLSFTTIDLTYLDSGLETERPYFYRLFAVDGGGNESDPSWPVEITLEGTGVEEEYTASLSLAGPNPFRSELALLYTVPSPGAVVTLELYDITGRLVRSVVDRFHEGGAYRVVWNGKNGRGHAVASGVYFCRISIGEWTDARKIVRIR